MRVLNCLLFIAGLIGGAGVVSAAGLTTFPVVIKGGQIIPARLEVPAGIKIKLTIRNEGPGPCEFENLDLRVEKVPFAQTRQLPLFRRIPSIDFRNAVDCEMRFQNA